MPPVRRGVENDVVGPPLDAAFEHRLEGFIRSILRIEGKIVAEYQESVRSAAQERHQAGQAFDVLAMDFDELQQTSVGAQTRIHRRMAGLDQRSLSHSA